MWNLALIPLVDVAHLAALLGIRPWRPEDAADLAVLRDLLTRREQRAAVVRADARPDMPPRLQLIESARVHPDLHDEDPVHADHWRPREALPGPATASGLTRWVGTPPRNTRPGRTGLHVGGW